MAKYSNKSQEEVKKVMHEFKEGKLKSGKSDKKVIAGTKQSQLVYRKRAKKAPKFLKATNSRG